MNKSKKNFKIYFFKLNFSFFLINQPNKTFFKKKNINKILTKNEGVKKKENKNELTIDVDLGKTHSCISIMKNGKVEIIEDKASGEKRIPSMV